MCDRARCAEGGVSRLDGYRTLLLDAAFRPLHAIRWQRAITLDLLDRVDVLEYYEEVVRSSSDAYPLPAVMRLRLYVHKHTRRVPFTRRNVLLRDGFCCQYCAVVFPARELTIDHVVPRSRGGPKTWENVVAACGICNRKKGARTPREARMRLLTVPRAPRFVPAGRSDLAIADPPALWRDYLPKIA